MFELGDLEDTAQAENEQHEKTISFNGIRYGDIVN